MKKTLSLLIALVIVLCMTPVSSGFASPTGVGAPMPRGRVCDACGQGQMFIKSCGSWSAWYLTGTSRPCPKFSGLKDYRQERGRAAIEQCNYCQRSFQYMQTEYRWLCTHV